VIEISAAGGAVGRMVGGKTGLTVGGVDGGGVVGDVVGGSVGGTVGVVDLLPGTEKPEQAESQRRHENRASVDASLRMR
jgi:hypothetical protein